jgi:hypothetical protein
MPLRTLARLLVLAPLLVLVPGLAIRAEGPLVVGEAAPLRLESPHP